MKVQRGQIARVVASPSAGWRLLLLHGPDEGGSRALASQVGRGLGDATRIDLSPAQLKADPARLADEAASASLFGERSWIRVEGAGDEIVPAVEALLDLPATDNPVVVTAGQLRKTSKLLQLVEASKHAYEHTSWLPQGREADQIVAGLARAEGLEVGGELARALHDAAGGDRGVLSAELAKFALYLDAHPERPRALDAEVVAALAEGADSEIFALTDAVLDRDAARTASEVDGLAATGVEGITVSRALLRALLPLARMRASVDGGGGVASVVQSERGLSQARVAQVTRQLGRWRPDTLAEAVTGFVGAELDVMTPGGPGPLAVSRVAATLAADR